ncbi:MAG: glycosyltransferase family 2 protein [Dehalococcoidales bacterium]|nr:glycosyltransferase family 2 protein [Dehalococcoidales bacterium]MDP7286037.1 glycosyltransferase family 2 protein [Dehalococcoidales bacterium]MDP7415312.1 glycosyltransferase family 2 protein [Dehalococcoidales bacterium]
MCIILPTLNEEEAIGRVIDEIPVRDLVEKGYEVEVLVVDGNSQDRTRQIAEAKGAEIIIESRKGKGRAMRTAFGLVDADFVFMLDADYTYPATYIPEMLAILRRDHSVVIGSRLKGEIEKGGMSRLNVVGNHLLTLMASILYRTKMSDLCTGYWGFRKEVISNLDLTADGFDFEADLFSQVVKKGYRLGEIPINYRRRQSLAKLNSIKDGLKIGRALISRRF